MVHVKYGLPYLKRYSNGDTSRWKDPTKFFQLGYYFSVFSVQLSGEYKNTTTIIDFVSKSVRR